jgi:hypothetical protein
MNKQLFVYVLGYFVFVGSLFLLLTLALPSTMFSEPKWVDVGCFAIYDVENGNLMNGTYAWRIIDVKESSGRRVVTINETFVGTSHWDHVAVWDDVNQNYSNIIPSNGRVTDVSVREGSAEGLVLWFTRYYNQFLLSRSFFLGFEGSTWRGVSEGKMPFQGEFRDVVQLSQTRYTYQSGPDFSREAQYDKITGLLLGYRWSWPHLGTMIVSLESTNVFDLVVNDQRNGLNMLLDILVVALLFAFPLGLAATGLFWTRRKNEILSRRFLLVLVLSNGIFFGLFTSWPIEIWRIYYLPALYILALIDIGFWISILGILTANVLMIRRLVIARKSLRDKSC